MQSRFVILTIIAFLLVTAQRPCPHRDFREMSLVQELVRGIQQQNQEEDRVRYLRDHVADSNKGLIAEHVKMIISTMKFTNGRVASVTIMDSFVLGLTCAEIVDIIKLQS